MKSFLRLVMLVLILTGWGLAASSLHVVRTQNDHILLIPKQRLGFRDTYVDARTWTLAEIAAHPALTERIVQSGKADQMKYVIGKDSSDPAAELIEAVRNPPTSAAPTSTSDKPASASAAGDKQTSAAPTTAGTTWSPQTVHIPFSIGI